MSFYELYRDKEVEKHIPALLEIMEQVLDGKETHGVPIAAEVKVGQNWAEMTKIKK